MLERQEDARFSRGARGKACGGRGGAGRKLCDTRREGGDRRCVQHVLDAEIDTEPKTQAGQHLRHRETFRTTREYVLIDADRVKLQEFRPQRGQVHFERGAGQNAGLDSTVRH